MSRASALRRFAPRSLRLRLLAGILLPVLVLVALNTWTLYRQALRSADTAYDRTLLASAKSIGEQLQVSPRETARDDGTPDHVAPAANAAAARPVQLRAVVPYSALEAFEADNRSRLFYKVTGFDGETVSGFADLPPWRGKLPDRSLYAALVDFYNDEYRDVPVRVAVLLQPVASHEGQGMATIQVAETLELRETLARQILIDTLWRQAALLGVIAVVVIAVVQAATRPVRQLSDTLRSREEGDLSPIAAPDAPTELQPLVDATNQVMGRLSHLLRHQKRFVRDASHQLRTPLAVLKTQVQSARRGDVDAAQALEEIELTVERATQLANQMLALARVEQLRQQGDAPALDWEPIVRSIALDLAPLIADRGLDFDIELAPVTVRAHEWALRELTRNLVHNAIKHGRIGGRLAVRLSATPAQALLQVLDDGPGLDPELRQRLFQPFAAGDTRRGSGLGLAICREIVASLDGSIALDDLPPPGGLEARVALPRVVVSPPREGDAGDASTDNPAS